MSRLLIDSCLHGTLLKMNLNESVAGGSRKNGYKFKGRFQAFDEVNKNKRLYTQRALAQNVKMLDEAVKGGGLVGELDHPTDSIIHFEKASHKITKLWFENNTLMGEGIILNTPHGMLLQALMDDGVRIGISSRGIGNGTTREDGVLVIDEDYKLITFDAVADPSTNSAFQERVMESLESQAISIGLSDYSEKIAKNVIKNETSSIDKKVNKDALIAYLGGLIQDKTANIIERLK